MVTYFITTVDAKSRVWTYTIAPYQDGYVVIPVHNDKDHDVFLKWSRVLEFHLALEVAYRTIERSNEIILDEWERVA